MTSLVSIGDDGPSTNVVDNSPHLARCADDLASVQQLRQLDVVRQVTRTAAPDLRSKITPLIYYTKIADILVHMYATQ